MLALQDDDGQYTGFGTWNNYARDAYSILILERSVGGGCVDSDGDGIGDVCTGGGGGAAFCDMDSDGDIKACMKLI